MAELSEVKKTFFYGHFYSSVEIAPHVNELFVIFKKIFQVHIQDCLHYNYMNIFSIDYVSYCYYLVSCANVSSSNAVVINE